MIAHNHRIKKDDNSLAVFNLSRSLNCPSSFYDYKLLLGCIYVTKNILLRLLPEEYNQILPHISNLENFKPINEINNEESFRKELYDLVERSERLMEALT